MRSSATWVFWSTLELYNIIIYPKFCFHTCCSLFNHYLVKKHEIFIFDFRTSFFWLIDWLIEWLVERWYGQQFYKFNTNCELPTNVKTFSKIRLNKFWCCKPIFLWLGDLLISFSLCVQYWINGCNAIRSTFSLNDSNKLLHFLDFLLIKTLINSKWWWT